LILDDPVISQVVFYPRKMAVPTQVGSNVKVLQFQITKEIRIGGFFFQNDPNLPTILLFHGNGEIAAEYQYFLPLFFGCGVNLAVVDYRGYGFSTGRPTFSCLFEDAIPVYQAFTIWMKDQNLHNSLFVLGRSLGSTCAAEIGAHNPAGLRGLIFESGIGSTYRIITQLFGVTGGQITTDALKEWSNDTRGAKFQRPVLIIHGTNDWIVHSDHAKIMYDAIPKTVEKELIYIEGAGHNDIFQYEQEYFIPLKKFIEKNK
jgi:pimeloyl-ACP methyl ester carboxylesterase